MNEPNAMLTSQLLDLPEQVHRGDFVLNLSEGVTAGKSERTLADYVVTPQLADAFDNALGFIKTALDARNVAVRRRTLLSDLGRGRQFRQFSRAWWTAQASHLVRDFTALVDGPAIIATRVLHVVLHTATESEDWRAVSHHKFCEGILIAMKDEAFQRTRIIRRRCRGAK